MFKPSLVTTRRIGTALLLTAAITLASAGQPVPAQAAPLSFEFTVVAVLDKPNATICVGDVVTSAARVMKFDDEKLLGTVTAGLTINGSVTDPSIGKFVVPRLSIGSDSSRPKDAVFAFRATKAGHTTLTYQAEISFYTSVLKWLYGPIRLVQSNPVDVKVVNCKYKLKTFSGWKVPGEAYTAIMENWAELTADANGNFTGHGTVTWKGFWQVVPAGAAADVSCATTLTAKDSAVDLTGQLNEDGYLNVTITFQSVAAPSWLAVCSGRGMAAPPTHRPIQLSPATVHIKLLSPTEVLSIKRKQELIDAMNGVAIVVVVPVAKQ